MTSNRANKMEDFSLNYNGESFSVIVEGEGLRKRDESANRSRRGFPP